MAAQVQVQQSQQTQHSLATPWWQSSNDLEDRKKLINKMCVVLELQSWLLSGCSSSNLFLTGSLFPCHSYTLFSQRKPNVTAEWQDKLPDFVKRLEEALYRNARSKVNSLP
jgi:hypothetical protein